MANEQKFHSVLLNSLIQMEAQLEYLRFGILLLLFIEYLEYQIDIQLYIYIYIKRAYCILIDIHFRN